MANAGGSPAPISGTSTQPSIRCMLSFYRSNFVAVTSGCESPDAQVAYRVRIKRTDGHGFLCGGKHGWTGHRTPPGASLHWYRIGCRNVPWLQPVDIRLLRSRPRSYADLWGSSTVCVRGTHLSPEKEA